MMMLGLFGCFSTVDFTAGIPNSNPDAEFMDADSVKHPDAMNIDAGLVDTGVYPDAVVNADSGEDAGTSTSADGGHPDAMMNADSGEQPDSAILDSGMLPDVAMLDSGMHPDAMVDSGVWAIICPENPRTDDELYVIENSDCALSMGTSNLPLPPQAGVQWHRIRDTVTSTHQDPLTTAQTQKEDQISATVTYQSGSVPLVVTPEVTIENSPPGMPNFSFRREIPVIGFVPYSANEFARTDDTVKCMMDAPASDADLDPLSYYLTLQPPASTARSSSSTTTHDIAVEQTLSVINPGANDVVSCTASVLDTDNALTSSTTRVEFCEKEYTTFSGSEYIQFNENSVFNLNPTGTMEAWVYWQGGQTQNAFIYHRWWPANADHQFGVNSLGQLFGVLSGKVGAMSLETTVLTASSPTIEEDKWTHVAMTWAVSSAGGSIYLFINGEQIASRSLMWNQITAGGVPTLGSGRGVNSLFGTIASFRISSTVRYHHNVDFTPDRNYGFDADTKIFIPLDEGSPTANVTATQTDGMGGSTTVQSTTNTSLWATERCIGR